jgi:hypothetical protein
MEQDTIICCCCCQRKDETLRFCVDCKLTEEDNVTCFFCIECENKNHASKFSVKHFRMDLNDYNCYNNNFRKNVDNTELKKDMKHSIVHVDHLSYKLKVTSHFYKLTKTDDYISFASFVGPTGVGKSLLIRLLSQEMSKENHAVPIAGAIGSVDSTSSDIHMYHGPANLTVEGVQGSFQISFLDCEGNNGSSNKTYL